jgi:hypothetical protein
MHFAAALSLKHFEFPMYWLDQSGKVVLQRFRDGGLRVAARALEGTGVMKWQLSEAEIECKKKMMAEYRTQRGTVSTFDPRIERFRPATSTSSSFSVPLCRDYLYQNRASTLLSHAASSALRKSASEEVRGIRRLAPAAG